MATKALSLIHLGFLLLSFAHPACSAPTLTGAISLNGRRDLQDLNGPPVAPSPNTPLPVTPDKTNPDPSTVVHSVANVSPQAVPSSISMNQIQTKNAPLQAEDIDSTVIPVDSPLPQHQPSNALVAVDNDADQADNSEDAPELPAATSDPSPAAYSPPLDEPSSNSSPLLTTPTSTAVQGNYSPPAESASVVTWYNSKMMLAATQIASYSTSYNTIGPGGALATGGFNGAAPPSSTDYDSDVPSPTPGPPGASQATEQSRRATVLGTFMTIGSLLALLACVLCARCHFSRRRRNKLILPEILLNDHEKLSISSGIEKERDSVLSGATDLVTLPVLGSEQVVISPLSSEPSPPQEWHALTTNESGAFEDVTHILSEAAYAEPDPSTEEIRSNVDAQTDDTSSQYRTSAGGSSVAAQSYTTCESHYSEPSIGHSSQGERLSFPIPAPVSDPIQPFGSTKPLLTRARSKTVTHTTNPTASAFSSSKSFPALSSAFRQRLSDDIRSSQTTQGSEWDVAQVYGRFSKESAGVGSILSTIAEDSDSMEAVEVSGKNCVLVKGRF